MIVSNGIAQSAPPLRQSITKADDSPTIDAVKINAFTRNDVSFGEMTREESTT